MKGPFRYDQVGSLLRTTTLKEAKKAYETGAYSKAEYKAIERAEIKKIVEKQKGLGLKAITDGEFNREYWHYDFISYLTGIHTYVAGEQGKFHGAMSKLKSYYVDGKLGFPKDHPFLDDFTYLLHLCGEGYVAKVTIPGPNMIYYSGVVNNALFKTHSTYQDLSLIKKDIARVYQEAIQAFYDAGCRYLQFDDTSWGALFSKSQREKLEEAGIDTNQLVKEFAQLTIDSVQYKPEDMVLTTHCCRGNFKSNYLYDGDYSFVEDDIFRAPFDGFFLEFDDERSGSLQIIQKATHGKVVLGLVTTKHGEIESKEAILSKIQEASTYLPLERLCLSCQCGFSSTEDGNTISEEEQYQKLALVKKIVEEVWQDNI